MSAEGSKEHLAGSLEVPCMPLPPAPAFGGGPGCCFSSARQQQPTQTRDPAGPPTSRNHHPRCGAVPQTLLGLPSACPCSYLGTVTVVALVPLPVFTQEQVQPAHSRLLFSPALSSPKTVRGEVWSCTQEQLALLSVSQCQGKIGRSPVPQDTPWVAQHCSGSPGTAGDRAPPAHRGFLG